MCSFVKIVSLFFTERERKERKEIKTNQTFFFLPKVPIRERMSYSVPKSKCMNMWPYKGTWHLWVTNHCKTFSKPLTSCREPKKEYPSIWLILQQTNQNLILLQTCYQNMWLPYFTRISFSPRHQKIYTKYELVVFKIQYTLQQLSFIVLHIYQWYGIANLNAKINNFQ